MRCFNVENINTPSYWDEHQTAMDFGIRQQKYLSLAGEGDKIAELGCGLSPFLEYARPYFDKCYGVDYSPKTVQKAQSLYPEVIYMVGDATNTEMDAKSLDVCVSGEVIEHIENPQDLIDEMVRITKRRIIISTPHLEFDDPEHLWEFTEEDFYKILKPYGKVTCETVHSTRFPGRSYIFAICDLK